MKQRYMTDPAVTQYPLGTPTPTICYQLYTLGEEFHIGIRPSNVFKSVIVAYFD